ncbi:MAG: tetratricopeptide repeat protein [Pseudomonadota bacterium]
MTGKITKQELKEPDKFQIMLSRVMAYLAENKKKIYIAGTVSVAVLLIAGAWYLYNLDMEKSAQKIYASSFYIAAGDMTAAAGVYKEVLTKYPHSRAALLANYRLANLYYQQKDFDAAIRHYEAFLKQTPDQNDLITIAYTGLGYCHEAKKDFKNALAVFEKAADSKTGQVFGSLNNQNIARIYEAMNDRAKALEYYRKALTNNADPIVELLLKRKIAALS